MPRLIWTPPALSDVQRLHRFLAPKDAGAARGGREGMVERAAFRGEYAAIHGAGETFQYLDGAA